MPNLKPIFFVSLATITLSACNGGGGGGGGGYIDPGLAAAIIQNNGAMMRHNADIQYQVGRDNQRSLNDVFRASVERSNQISDEFNRLSCRPTWGNSPYRYGCY